VGILLVIAVVATAILLWLNSLASLAVKYDHTLDKTQKIAQIFIVWLVPFFGAAFVLHLVSEHYPQAIPRNVVPRPSVNTWHVRVPSAFGLAAHSLPRPPCGWKAPPWLYAGSLPSYRGLLASASLSLARRWIPWPFKKMIFGTQVKPNKSRDDREIDHVGGGRNHSARESHDVSDGD
jgi:hypothetical protein